MLCCLFPGSAGDAATVDGDVAVDGILGTHDQGGPTLAAFMIEHNVGVKLTKGYELKEVSNDFFDEDEE